MNEEVKDLFGYISVPINAKTLNSNLKVPDFVSVQIYSIFTKDEAYVLEKKRHFYVEN